MTITTLNDFATKVSAFTSSTDNGYIAVGCWMPELFVGGLDVSPQLMKVEKRDDPNYGSVITLWTPDREVSIPTEVVDSVIEEYVERTGVMHYTVCLKGGSNIKIEMAPC